MIGMNWAVISSLPSIICSNMSCLSKFFKYLYCSKISNRHVLFLTDWSSFFFFHLFTYHPSKFSLQHKFVRYPFMNVDSTVGFGLRWGNKSHHLRECIWRIQHQKLWIPSKLPNQYVDTIVFSTEITISIACLIYLMYILVVFDYT